MFIGQQDWIVAQVNLRLCVNVEQVYVSVQSMSLIKVTIAFCFKNRLFLNGKLSNKNKQKTWNSLKEFISLSFMSEFETETILNGEIGEIITMSPFGKKQDMTSYIMLF